MASFLDLNGLSYFWNKIKAKFIAEPATEGTNGQVLTTDGNGGRSWTTPAGVTVDAALSSTSLNPVQNKVINTALNGKQATLATSNATYTNSTYFNASFTFYKYGRVVTCQMNGQTKSVTTPANTTLFSVAAAYRPVANTPFFITTGKYGYINASTGAVSVNPALSASTPMGFCFAYIAAS